MKIAAISPNPTELERIGRILREATRSAPEVLLIAGGMNRLRATAEDEDPDVVLIDGACRDAHELGELEYVCSDHPRLIAILLCDTQSPEFLLQAMRAGVREVLGAPPTREALIGAIARAEQKLASLGHTRHTARVLAFVPCKGGSGATFLAANTAYQLAASGRKVLLIDLNLQFGDAALFLSDQPPRTTIADVAHNIQRLDASLLNASLAAITESLGVLAAPEDPGQAAEIHPEHVDALLDLASGHYDFIVLDIGRSLDAVTIKAMDRAHQVFPVLQTTLPFVRDAHRLFAAFRSLGYAPEKILAIVNRYERGSDITLDDLQNTLRCRRPHLVPNSYQAVAASVNRGRPMLELARHNPVTQAIQELVQAQLPPPEEPQGWLDRLLRREKSA